MQKEKRSFEVFQGIDKTCVNAFSAAAGQRCSGLMCR
jgi:hypothetical protein